MAGSKVIEKVRITGISSDGKSVGRNDNQVIFIKGAVPGDLIDVKVTGRKKKFLEGYALNFHEYSADRTDPFCDHFGTCGGCKWQNLSYEAQLKYKQDHVEQNLGKLTGIELPPVQPILGSQQTTYYRNKLEFTFSNNRWLTREEINSGEELSRNALGFHIPKRFDKILQVDHCWLQSDVSNKIRNGLYRYALEKDLSFFDIKEHQGLLRNLIIRTTTTGDVMVIVQFHEESDQVAQVMKFLSDSFPEITSLNFIINPKRNETFYDLPVHLFSGESYITEEMEGLKFRIGPKSFYQTNSQQAYELYKVTRNLAGLTGNELVYDLYTGTGTIANFVAKQARHVVGVESVQEAIADARVNSEINGIKNTTFLAGDMKDMMNPEFIEQHGRPDVIITDPPRAGMHKDVVNMIRQIRPQRLIYVSCNPSTQARDIELLAEDFVVKAIQPVDMFPQTHHVECVMLLELRK